MNTRHKENVRENVRNYFGVLLCIGILAAACSTTARRDNLDEPATPSTVPSSPGGGTGRVGGARDAGPAPGDVAWPPVADASPDRSDPSRPSPGDPPPGAIPTPTGRGVTYYVDLSHPKAADSNPGTEEFPWKTPYAWIKVVKAGDTVLVKNGTYNITGGNWTTAALNPANSGAPGNSITLKAFPGHTPVLLGDGGNNVIGSNHRDSIVIEGFTIRKGYIAVFNTSAGVFVQGNTISDRHCPAKDNCEGIRLEKASNVVVRNNRISNIYNEAHFQNASAIKNYGGQNNLFEYNEIYDTVDGFFSKSAKGPNIGFTLRYNYIHDIEGRAIHAGAASNFKIYGNIIKGASMALYAGGGHEFYSNTLVNVKTLFVNTTVKEAWNNISYSVASSKGGSKGVSVSYCDYNLSYRGTTICGAKSLQNTDPKFLDTTLDSVDDFRLQPGSPAKAMGRNGEDLGAYLTGKETIGLWK